MYTCAHVRMIMCLHANVCVSRGDAVTPAPRNLCKSAYLYSFTYLQQSDISSVLVFTSVSPTEASEGVQVLPCCFWNNADLLDDKFTLELSRDAKH